MVPASATLPLDRRVAAPAALAAGLVHAAAVLGVAARWYPLDSALVAVWIAPGLVLLVGVPTYLLLRRGVVSALATAVALSAYSVYVEATTHTPGDPLGLYVTLWVLPLGVALLVGGAEYAVRRRVARRRA